MCQMTVSDWSLGRGDVLCWNCVTWKIEELKASFYSESHGPRAVLILIPRRIDGELLFPWICVVLCMSQSTFIHVIIRVHSCYLAKAEYDHSPSPFFLDKRTMAFLGKRTQGRITSHQNQQEVVAAVHPPPPPHLLITLNAKNCAKHLINITSFHYHLSSMVQVLLWSPFEKGKPEAARSEGPTSRKWQELGFETPQVHTLNLCALLPLLPLPRWGRCYDLSCFTHEQTEAHKDY